MRAPPWRMVYYTPDPDPRSAAICLVTRGVNDPPYYQRYPPWRRPGALPSLGWRSGFLSGHIRRCVLDWTYRLFTLTQGEPQMSRGTQVFTVRLAEDLVEQVRAELAKRAEHSLVPPQEFSEFVRLALVHEIQHRQRGRASRRRRARTDAEGWPQEIVRLAQNPQEL